MEIIEFETKPITKGKNGKWSFTATGDVDAIMRLEQTAYLIIEDQEEKENKED